MSLLQQLRPTPWEVEKRRWGPRTYDPNYNLYQHLTPESVDQAREMRPIKFPNVVHETESGERWYPTKNGWLDKDLMEKFSLHGAFTSKTKSEYVDFLPRIRPPDYGSTKHERNSDMVRFNTRRYEDCAQEWQSIYNYNDLHDGRLPEQKAWPHINQPNLRFPNFVGERSNLFRKLNKGGRTEEQMEKVNNEIHDLVRKEKLMPQYIRPTVNQMTFDQREMRPFEQLERPDSRNPVNMQSYSHALHRRFPAYEYKQPTLFMHKSPISRTAVLTYPYNVLNLRFPIHSCKLTDQVPWDKPLYLNQF